MKSIPTQYNGVLYRSKLEAKWAAYFDMCGARFEYEPQAFDLGGGVRYLPDFCVSDVLSVHGLCGYQTLENSRKYKRFWFECKGVMSEYDKEKINRFRSAILEGECQECPFYVLDRSPIMMFNDFLSGEPFTFSDIDCDEYPFVIGKPVEECGVGLFGGDGNYLKLMDYSASETFAKKAEKMFRWNPKEGL